MISKNKIKYIHSLEQKKYRVREGVFVAEGYKIVGDMLPFFDCTYIAATSQWLEQNQTAINRHAQNAEIDEVTEEELRKASLLESPQQVLAIFTQPHTQASIDSIANTNLCIALDDVQNPGNLGTIIRLADWFGIEHIFCSKNCADVYNPKTIQSTMGALAHVSVHYVDLPEALKSISGSCPIYGTFLDGENMYTKQLSANGVIVMGNEGKGVSKDVESLVDEKLFIPNYPEGRVTSESLNVAIATAVVCSEFRRRIS